MIKGRSTENPIISEPMKIFLLKVSCFVHPQLIFDERASFHLEKWKFKINIESKRNELER